MDNAIIYLTQASAMTTEEIAVCCLAGVFLLGVAAGEIYFRWFYAGTTGRTNG